MDRIPVLLSVRHRGKGVPYLGSGQKRADGDANFGFQNLKSAPEGIESLPEVQSDPALKHLLQRANAPETCVFTVGCVSGPHRSERGHAYCGYIEFALNSKKEVRDASSYFPLFFHFSRRLHAASFRAVRIEWELEGASFTDAGVDGFTCAVFVNTEFRDSPEAAYELWANALSHLGDHLEGTERGWTDYIYEPVRPPSEAARA